MRKFVGSSTVDGEVPAPPSKSLMIRAVAAAVLSEGRRVVVRNPSVCDDAEAALGVAEGLGAAVERAPGSVILAAGAGPPASVLDCGESGLCLRMFSAVAALRSEEFLLEGRGTLAVRPVAMIERSLRALGAACETRGGLPPVRVRGPLRGGRAEVDGAVSSQFLTGLLLALPRAPGDSELAVPELKSAAYAEMTLDFLRRSGIEVEGRLPGVVRIRGGQSYRAAEYAVEGDWSGAAFLLVAGALAGRVRVTGLDPASLQPDKAVLEALRRCGADLTVSGPAVEVKRRSLRPFSMDLDGSPDLFPPLAVLACFCEEGTTRLAGIGRLRHKESDRAEALREELGRLGADVGFEGDALVIRGGPLRGGTAEPRGDHRMAMALAVAGLRAERGVAFSGAQCAAKSYPRFFEDLMSVGGRVHE